jgi:hypothetical protein
MISYNYAYEFILIIDNNYFFKSIELHSTPYMKPAYDFLFFSFFKRTHTHTHTHTHTLTFEKPGYKFVDGIL